MRFSISTAFLPTDQLVPIAKAADELGFDSLAMPDHVVDLETLRTPYPYTPDGAPDEAIRWATRLGELRAELGAEGDFSVFVALLDSFLPEHFVRAEEGGVTDCMTMPWMYYSGRDAPIEQKIEGMTQFANDVIRPLAGG